MSILQGSSTGSTRGFYPKTLEGSLRFNDDDSAYLSWTPASDGDRQKWTFSFWAKTGDFGTDRNIFTAGPDVDNRMTISFGDTDKLLLQSEISNVRRLVESDMVFRDPSAWYHILVAFDTTQGTSSNRIKAYVNGVQISLTSVLGFPDLNDNTYAGSAQIHKIGQRSWTSGSEYDGYLAEVHFTDGTAYTADDFGELKNGVWVAKDPSVTYGTNGFYLNFQDDTAVEAFNTVLWNGYNKDVSVTGCGFSPDLVWAKSRGAGTNHFIFDTVRGAGKMIHSNATTAEITNSPYGYLSSFDSDGMSFKVGSSDGTYGTHTGHNYVAWCWDAGANNAVTGHSSVTYTGNGIDNTKISGLPFAPDLIWGKKRSAAGSHFLLDSVRGVNSTLSSDTTSAEDTTADIFRGFDKDGFILGSNGQSNSSGVTYVAWAWDAGDSAPVSNTDGSITSTVKASPTNGFSIVSYTGTLANATVGHGLSSAPTFMIIRDRNNANDWAVWHTDIGTDKLLKLNTTGAPLTNTSFWNDTAPTSSVIHLGTTNLTNNNGNNICYAWHDVTGKQKFGSYTGTGSDVTVNVGFRPGFLLVKWTGGGGATAENWAIVDASRDPINNLTKGLFPNTSGAEQDSALNNEVEFTSTGFVVKNTDARWNANGGTYIYAAFAGSYSDYITDYNTDGSIDSRVKASDTTGFSIISYKGNGVNGATVGHGLSAAPDFVITKTRTQAENWNVQHVDSQRLNLNLTGAQVNNYLMTFNPSTVTLTDLTYQNGNGYDMIMYAWKETTGVSKFGSYEGTGASGNAITGLGFKPSLVIIKGADTSTNWHLIDDTRDTASPQTKELRADASDAEADNATNVSVSFGSDGFTVNSTTGFINNSGQTFIYAAFADTREAAFWLDQSGNDNDWQPNNLDHNDTVLDSPTDNFATWNPIAPYSGSTYSEGNLKVTTGSSQYGPVLSTIAVSSGKYYVEFTQGSGSYTQLGCVSTDKTLSTTIGLGSGNNSFAYVQNDGSFRQGSVTTSGYGDTWTTGDVIGMALDLDNDEVTYYKNGVSQGTVSILNASVGLTSGKTYFIALSDNDAGGGTTVTANFGQQPFKYGPPA